MASRCGSAVSRKRCALSAGTPATSGPSVLLPGGSSGATGRFTKLASLRTSGRRLDDDHARHVWMQRAEVLVQAGCGEFERKLAVRIECFRPELLSDRRDRVRDIVLVVPRHGGPGLHS